MIYFRVNVILKCKELLWVELDRSLLLICIPELLNINT